MPIFTDQTGSTISLSDIPKRIVSLVPSQTELLHYLGLENEVAGITKFCIHPKEWFASKTRVGGTKQLNIEKIKQLQPDLIIANKEENVKDQIETLANDFPVWISDVNNLEDAYDMIEQIGLLTGTRSKAIALSVEIKKRFEQLTSIQTKDKTAYLIWQKPYMTVGGDTFISAMMNAAGFSNLFANEDRYPVITIEQFRQQDCRYLLLSSEPFPFAEKHKAALQKQLPDTRILLVDGEMFSWYGNRMLKAPKYFISLHSALK